MERGLWSEIEGLSSLDAYNAAEALVGVPLDLMRLYLNWYGKIEGNHYIEHAAATGRLLVASWHPFVGGKPAAENTAATWNEIAAGAQDAHIRDMGGQLARYMAAGGRALFSFHHEPEDDCPPINHAATCSASTNPVTQGAEFRRAFNRVRKLFIEAGVPASAIGATLEGSTYRGNHGGPDLWFPRTAAWLGSDGYNRGGVCGGRWMTFDETFGMANAKAEALGKPFLIQEIGCPEGLNATGPQSKVEWFEQMGAALASWPRVFAWCYSHVSAICDYHVNTSPESLAAFKAVLA